MAVYYFLEDLDLTDSAIFFLGNRPSAAKFGDWLKDKDTRSDGSLDDRPAAIRLKTQPPKFPIQGFDLATAIQLRTVKLGHRGVDQMNTVLRNRAALTLNLVAGTAKQVPTISGSVTTLYSIQSKAVPSTDANLRRLRGQYREEWKIIATSLLDFHDLAKQVGLHTQMTGAYPGSQLRNERLDVVVQRLCLHIQQILLEDFEIDPVGNGFSHGVFNTQHVDILSTNAINQRRVELSYLLKRNARSGSGETLATIYR